MIGQLEEGKDWGKMNWEDKHESESVAGSAGRGIDEEEGAAICGVGGGRALAFGVVVDLLKENLDFGREASRSSLILFSILCRSLSYIRLSCAEIGRAHV